MFRANNWPSKRLTEAFMLFLIGKSRICLGRLEAALYIELRAGYWNDWNWLFSKIDLAIYAALAESNRLRWWAQGIGPRGLAQGMTSCANSLPLS
jgi:hypothetical protein